MDVSALVVQELELDGSISTHRMVAEPGHRLTVGFADEFTDPRSGPFHFTAERNEKAFAEGFANRYVRKLSESLFSVSGDKYRLELPWQGCQRFYALSLPEFAIPWKIMVWDPHSKKPLYKYVVRDDQRNRFVIYINRIGPREDFEFVLGVRFMIGDRKTFVDAKIPHDEYVSRYGNRSDPENDFSMLSPRKAKRHPRPQTPAELKRAAKIRAVIKSGLKGPLYCKRLDFEEVNIPTIWVWKGCPKTYAEAYKDPRWRKYINNEKWSMAR